MRFWVLVAPSRHGPLHRNKISIFEVLIVLHVLQSIELDYGWRHHKMFMALTIDTVPANNAVLLHRRTLEVTGTTE